MTRKPRTQREIEDKLVELYIKLHKRKTQKISRRTKLKRTIESFKDELQKITQPVQQASEEPIPTTPINDE